MKKARRVRCFFSQRIIAVMAILSIVFLLVSCGAPQEEAPPIETQTAASETEPPQPSPPQQEPLFAGVLDQNITMEGDAVTAAPVTSFGYPAALDVYTSRDGITVFVPSSEEEKDAMFYFTTTSAAPLGDISDPAYLREALIAIQQMVITDSITPAGVVSETVSNGDAGEQTAVTYFSVDGSCMEHGSFPGTYQGVMASRIVEGSDGGQYILAGYCVASEARIAEAEALLYEMLTGTRVIGPPPAPVATKKASSGSDPGDTEDWSDPGDTEDWSDPGDTEDWSDPGDTEDWSDPGDTEDWSDPGDTWDDGYYEDEYGEYY